MDLWTTTYHPNVVRYVTTLHEKKKRWDQKGVTRRYNFRLFSHSLCLIPLPEKNRENTDKKRLDEGREGVERGKVTYRLTMFNVEGYRERRPTQVGYLQTVPPNRLASYPTTLYNSSKRV